MVKYQTIFVTFFNKPQTCYLISMFNKVLGHGSTNWTIRNRIMSKVKYGRVMRNTPVLINADFDEETIGRIRSAITYAELRFMGDE